MGPVVIQQLTLVCSTSALKSVCLRAELQITNRSETINAEIKIIFGTVNTKWPYIELRSVEGIYYTNKQITWLARRKRPTGCRNTVQ